MSQPAFPGHVSREDPDLTERQRSVLESLIDLHGGSARPVGSEVLARESRLGLSAASIRSELAELEALGLVEQPRTAAGRIPTGAGYDLYVRRLMAPVMLPQELLDELERRLDRSSRDVEHLLSEASRLLSSFTGQLGLAVTSSLEHGELTGLDLEPLDERRALMVLNLGQQTVRTLVLELDSPLRPDELEEVAGVLRERLIGHTLGVVRERLALDPELVRRSAVRIVALAAQRSPSWPAASPLFSAGARHMAEHPEFAASVRLGSILDVVERGFPLDHLMVSTVEGHPVVRVGLDEAQALVACSLVSYSLPGGVCGAVGVLGPRRMNYATTLAVVDSVGSRIADILQS